MNEATRAAKEKLAAAGLLALGMVWPAELEDDLGEELTEEELDELLERIGKLAPGARSSEDIVRELRGE